jgi:hypothetical protein
MLRPAVASAVLFVACTGGDRDEPGRNPPKAPATLVPTDAAVAPPPPPLPPAIVDGGVTALPTFDPASGFHLDDAPVVRTAGRIAARERKPVQLLLRSTPLGAVAAVDGVIVGRTPVLWEGVLDGQSHDFTFALPGHDLARYKFVPVTSGIVHGTLVKVTDDHDAGMPAIPQPVDASSPPP